MDGKDTIQLAEALAWPVVVLIALWVVPNRLEAVIPRVAGSFGGAKVKLSLMGQSIETTLPELQQVLQEQAGEPLTGDQEAYLRSLLGPDGRIERKSVEGTTEDYKDAVLKPLRDAGLILTYPPHKRLDKATHIQVSALGRLYLKHAKAPAKPAPSAP